MSAKFWFAPFVLVVGALAPVSVQRSPLSPAVPRAAQDSAASGACQVCGSASCSASTSSAFGRPANRPDTSAFSRPALTGGYAVVNFGVGLRLAQQGLVHNISIHCDNVFNRVYRDNLSVIKDFIPQPARGFRVNYELIY